jgi:hypothetical protein
MELTNSFLIQLSYKNITRGIKYERHKAVGLQLLYETVSNITNTGEYQRESTFWLMQPDICGAVSCQVTKYSCVRVTSSYPRV